MNLSYSTRPILGTSITKSSTTNRPPQRHVGDDTDDDNDDDESEDAEEAEKEDEDGEADSMRGTGRKDQQSVQLVINKAAILNEIARLGGDMVSRIEVLKPLS